MRIILLLFCIVCNMSVLFSQSEYDTLLEELNSEIVKDSLNPFYFKARGDVFILKEKYSFAIQDFSKAITLKSNYSQAYTSRALAYHKQGELQKSLSDFNHVIETYGNITSSVYYNRGVVLQEMKRYSEAIFDYEKSLKIDENNGKACYNLGIVFLELKQFNKALNFLRQSSQIMPDDVLVYTNIGYTEYHLKNYTSAIKSLKYSLTLDSLNYYAYKWIGLSYLKLDKQELSEEYLQKAEAFGVNIDNLEE